MQEAHGHNFLDIQLLPDRTVHDANGKQIGTWDGIKEIATGVRHFSIQCEKFLASVKVYPNGDIVQEDLRYANK